MKKFYLLLLGALAVAPVNAVNLKLFMGEQEITPGSTVYFKDYQAEEYESGVWDIMMNPELSVESDFFTSDVTITAECTSGHKIQLCAGGSCETGYSITKTGITLRKGERFNLDFEFIDMEYEGPTVPDVTTNLTIQTPDDDPVGFTLTMGPSGASLNMVEVTDNISFSNGAITYNMQSPALFSLYSLIGNRMLSTELEGNGTISTAALPAGVYIYTIGRKTGKILIR